MRVLYTTSSAAGYMRPPLLGDEQINCGPDWADERGSDGRYRSLATPVGTYDLAAVAARLPPGQQPDLVVCLVDASWRNLPCNLRAFTCPRILLVADTHHLRTPLVGMLRYLAAETYDRVVLLYDRHHAPFFQAAGCRQLFWLPGLTFPHEDKAVRSARNHGVRAPHIAFVGQAGRHHPRRARLLAALAAGGLALEQKAVPQDAALEIYGNSLLGFNASLNGDFNLRALEILAAGGALLTDRLAPESGVASLLGEGRELLCYGSEAELVERARHALSHPAETKALGAAGARWFDEHLSAARRRELFRKIAFDGRAAPEFSLAEPSPTQFWFGGDQVQLGRALALYEDLQETHRTRERVMVDVAPGAGDDLRAMLATLPRIEVRADPAAAAGDYAVIGPDTEPIVPAEKLWCSDPPTEAQSARLRALGYAPLSAPDGCYVRLRPERPAETVSPLRLEGLKLLAAVARQAGDEELCITTASTLERAAG